MSFLVAKRGAENPDYRPRSPIPQNKAFGHSGRWSNMPENFPLADICARMKVVAPVIDDTEAFLAGLQAALDAIREDLLDSLEELEDLQAELDEDAEL